MFLVSDNIDWASLAPYVDCAYHIGNQSASSFKLTFSGTEIYDNFYGLLCFRQAPPKLVCVYLGANDTIANFYVNDSTKLTYSINGNELTLNYADTWSDCAFIYLKKRGRNVTIGR